MSSHLRKSWRDAATLIIAAKTPKISTSGFDYRILCMKRSVKTSFLSNHICYPGGSIEEQDQTINWIDHFKKHGVSTRDLDTLTLDYHKKRTGNASIFHDKDENSLSRAVSLRISAIREAFEELGVLLCKPSIKNSILERKSSNFLRTNDIVTYQQQVHDREITFLQLCDKLNVIPDVFSLFEWSCWLTPTTFPARRFQTAFFLCFVDEQLPIYPEPKEAYSYFWRTPDEYIKMLHEDLVWYHPPQFYEFCRLCNFKNLKSLMDFAEKREVLGSALFMPVVFKCSDGMAFVLPGDESYPKNPSLIKDDIEPMSEAEELSMKDFRKRNKILNRIEIKSPSEVEIFSNCEPNNGHLRPVTTFDVALNNVKNKL